MNKKMQEATKLIRQLVSDIQGAPYPGRMNEELYSIWYEHIQRDGINALEFIDANCPVDFSDDIEKTLKKAF